MITRLAIEKVNFTTMHMLSRLPLKETVGISYENQLYNIQVGSLPVTSQKIHDETENDSILQLVVNYLKHDSWPSTVNPELKQCASIKDEMLLVQDGIVMWGLRVIIPKSLQLIMLNEFHHNHPGIVRMKALSRIHLWYPNINRDIEELVRNCNQLG